MPRSFQDIIDHADELADAIEAYEPAPGDDVTTPEMLLRRAAWERAEAERALVEAIVEARGDGVPWTAVGDALGTSAQAAQKRYSVVVSIRSGPTKKPKKPGRDPAKRGPARPVKRSAVTGSRKIAAKRSAVTGRAPSRKIAAKSRGTPPGAPRPGP
jgi:hypothetical protein